MRAATRLFLAVLALLLPAWPALSPAQATPAPVLPLAEVIAEALQHNPELVAAKNNWTTAKARIALVSSLDDPKLSYTYLARRVETRVGPQRQKFGLSQTFPFFGKLSLRGQVARRQAERAHALYEAKKLEIVARVKVAYYELFMAHKAIQITRENVEILRRFAKIATVKYATGKVAQADVLKAQVELSKLANELLTLEQQRETAEAALNVLLNRAPQAPLGVPAEPTLVPLARTLAELQQLALAQQPLLRASQEGIAQSKAALALAKRQYYPDFTLGVDYIEVEGGTTPSPEDGKDAVLVTLRLNIPLWQGRLKAGVQAARAAMRASEARYAVVRNNVLFAVEDALVKVQTAERLVDLFTTTLLPQAQQSLEAATIGYQADKVDFLDLLESQRILKLFQLDYYRALVAFQQRLAELERLVGVELAPAESQTPVQGQNG